MQVFCWELKIFIGVTFLLGEVINMKLAFFFMLTDSLIENSSHFTVQNWFNIIYVIWSMEDVSIVSKKAKGQFVRLIGNVIDMK